MLNIFYNVAPYVQFPSKKISCVSELKYVISVEHHNNPF